MHTPRPRNYNKNRENITVSQISDLNVNASFSYISSKSRFKIPKIRDNKLNVFLPEIPKQDKLFRRSETRNSRNLPEIHRSFDVRRWRDLKTDRN